MWLKLRVSEYNHGDYIRLINSEHISSISQKEGKGAVLKLYNQEIEVRETLDQIEEMLNKCGHSKHGS